jgi:hypothetical protein
MFNPAGIANGVAFWLISTGACGKADGCGCGEAGGGCICGSAPDVCGVIALIFWSAAIAGPDTITHKMDIMRYLNIFTLRANNQLLMSRILQG